MKKITAIISIFTISLFAGNDFPIINYPTFVVNPNDKVFIEWVNPTGSNPLKNKIYFSRNPGGAIINNYKDSIIEFNPEGIVEMTGISFVPSKNPHIKPGINYMIVANKENGVASNEIKFILKHTDQNTNVNPSGGFVGSTTPQFSWTKPVGVPYSHIILSDESVKIDSGKVSTESIKGVSMIWQAITPNNRITYGDPDPSGIFTTVPPPLSPGKKYTWLVFNNYGNSPAYTPSNDMVIPAFFAISGQGKKEPKNIYPVSKDTSNLLKIISTDSGGVINFKWNNLDTNVNVYQVFVYTNAKMNGIEAQLTVWSGEVTAGQFKGSDTASLKMSAKDILSENAYAWRVIAIYKDGSGQVGELSKFKYSAPSGTIFVNVKEEINFAGNKYDDHNLALTEVSVEVLEGSLEKSLLFFTDNNGNAVRVRAVGTQKVTVKREGYESDSKIVQIKEGDTTFVNFLLSRPSASIYGKITDKQGYPVNLANITAISDNGDTVKTQSLPSGNFVLNCFNGNWTLIVAKQGYINSGSNRVILKNKENFQQNIQIEKNMLVFSGTIRNSDGSAIAGATVKVFSEDGSSEVAALLSTPNTGRFSFSLLPGTYRISATKTGHVSYPLKAEDGIIQFSSSQNKDIVIASGAALLKGTLYGESWIAKNGTLDSISGAVVNAKVEIINPVTQEIVATSVTDKTYGTYDISVPATDAGVTYRLRFSAQGFYSDSILTKELIKKETTYYLQNFSIKAYASISGKVFRDGGAPVSGISVSLINVSSSVASASVKTDKNGDFTFFRVPKGIYAISANGNGLAKDYIEQIASGSGSVIRKDTVTIEDGRFYSNATKTTPIAYLNIYTQPANAKIIWTARTNEAAMIADASVSIAVYSPFMQNVEHDASSGGSVLSGIIADQSIEYLAKAAAANDKNLIDCIKRTVIMPFEDGFEIFKDTIFMPFRYVPDSGVSVAGQITLKLSAWQSFVKIDSSFVYYRYSGETSFEKYSPIRGTNSGDLKEISFNISPEKAGQNIEFYFWVSAKTNGEANSTVYSNKTHPYTKFVTANPSIITRLELLPVTNNLTLALKSRTELYVKAYYGANFEPVKLNANQFEWATTSDKILGISKDSENASALINGKTAGQCTLSVWIKPNSGLKTAEGVSDTVKLPIKITDSEISTIKIISLSESEHPDYITNKEPMTFAIEAKDKKGNIVSATPRWIINPPVAETPVAEKEINKQNGLFTPNDAFIGRAYISAQINSKIRDDFSINDRKGLLVAYTATADEKKVGNKSAELAFDSQAAATAITVSIDNPVINNSGERDVEEKNAFIISDIFEIKRQVGEDFANPDGVNVKLFVPEIYHGDLSNGVRDGEKLGIAVWDKKNLRWEYYDRKVLAGQEDSSKMKVRAAKYDSNEKSLALSIGEYINEYNSIRIGIVGKDVAAGAVVQVSPNPFSPFVSPLNDYVNIISDMSNDVKGTCIKITSKSNATKFKTSAQVGIYTAEGTMVYHATLNGLDAGQSYYLFWDGRTQISSTALSKIGISPNKALFVPGNEMCRNGRYFVNVTLDDGKEKMRYTKEIILFK